MRSEKRTCIQQSGEFETHCRHASRCCEGPKFYVDADELINDPEVNAIYIATPPSTHELYTIAALKSGKPVYVEKPVTMDSASCQRMIDFAVKSGGKVSVAHYRRELPLFRKVRELINDGAIGKVRLIQLRVLQAPKKPAVSENFWRVDPAVSGGGLFYDLSPHQLDIMYWMFGVPTMMHGTNLNQSKAYDAPDVTSLDALFSGDIFFKGIWAFNLAENSTDDSCEIMGEKGKIKFSFFKKSTIEITTDSGTEILEPEYPHHIQEPMIDAVAKFFLGTGPNPCSLNEALEVMRMMECPK